MTTGVDKTSNFCFLIILGTYPPWRRGLSRVEESGHEVERFFTSKLIERRPSRHDHNLCRLQLNSPQAGVHFG